MSIKLARKPICRVNDSVYELYRPIGRPSMQVLFFHGLQLGDYEDAHLTTWESRDRSHLWPQTWLVDEFPDAHVLSISYDARVRKEDGNFDLHIIGENLTSDLTGANIGQEAHCPVILVGHCFGGIVIKQLCLHARQRVDLKGDSTDSSSKLNKFLQNIKGIFYYATPHRGIPLDIVPHFLHGGPLLPFVKILSKDPARLNYDFDALRHGQYKNAWRIAGVGESLPTKWGHFRGVVVVPEASARDGDTFHLVEADHISICKPERVTSRSFYDLTNLLHAIVRDLKVSLPVHECTGLPSYSVNLKGPAREIQEKLKVEQVLGIVGMGGIGKTTLAKEVFNGISQDFEYTCFVDNVKGVEKLYLKPLSDWIQSQFYCNGRRVDGGRIEWSDLKQKKVLIGMDDVDSVEQLKVLPNLNFDNGSRVIITTRNKNVLKLYKTKCVYEVKSLQKEDATKLFCKQAFDQEEVPNSLQGMEQLVRYVRTVVNKCDGLPLTLEVMGRYLNGHKDDAEFWEGTITSFGQAQLIDGDEVDKVWATLKVSYDALISEDRKMFTSAATFFFDWPLEQALAAWSTTCGRSGTGWANLLSRCLVKEVSKVKFDSILEDYITFNVVWVHEHFRDMVKDLMAKDLAPSNMEYASDEESAQSLVERLNAKQVKAETEFLYISRNIEFTLPCKALLNVKQLKYMELNGVLLEGSPKEFPRQLSLLHWDAKLHWTDRDMEEGGEIKNFPVSNEKFPGKNFPVSYIEGMENLAALQLGNWQTCEAFPKGLEKLTNLRILHLGNIQAVDLVLLPEDLSQLSRLKHLDLINVSISKLPESFGCLSSLVTLRLLGCDNLVILPENFGRLRSLEELVLGSRRLPGKLESLPDTFGQLKALRKLTMHQSELQSLPSSFGLLKSLHELYIEADHLEMLPDVGQLASLQVLTIVCRRMKELPDSLGHLASLRELTISCWDVKELPDSLGHLASLRELTISCWNVKELPDSLGHLASLRELWIYSSEVKELPDSLGHLASLRKLAIHCPEVNELPASLGQMSSLLELQIEYSPKELPASLAQLSSLRWLKVSDHGGNLKELSNSLEQLSLLEKFTIDARCLARFPEWVGGLRSLKILKITYGQFEFLPESLGHLSSLQTLEIWFCKKLKSLPNSLGRPSSSQITVDTQNLNRLSNSLRKISVYGCHLLDDSVLKNLGWFRVVESPLKYLREYRPADS